MSYRLLIVTIVCAVFFSTPIVWAVDEENCLLCHRYSGLGRIDEKGKKHLYYVNEALYNRSAHAKVRCGECHADIKGFPHGTVKKVDCAVVCHLVDPSSGKSFSHASMIEKYELSVHGRGTKDKPKQHAEDLPTCTYCHDNRIFHETEGPGAHREGIAQEIYDRCMGCHTNKEWTDAFYHHFAERLYERRSSKLMVDLCTSCHEDEEKMARHNIKAVGTFRDTFHWQAIKYSDPNAPNCITCHAPVGYFSHEIMKKDDPSSAIYRDNLVRTCGNQGGVQVCHPAATQSFAQGAIHPAQYKTGLFENKADAFLRKRDIEKGQMKPFQSLLGQILNVDPGDPSYYQNIILILIKYFYMALIGGLIGFMIVHQILDYFATRRELRKGRH